MSELATRLLGHRSTRQQAIFDALQPTLYSGEFMPGRELGTGLSGQVPAMRVKLRRQGYTIETAKGPSGGYRLTRIPSFTDRPFGCPPD